MTSKKNEILLCALKNGDLDKFLLGDEPYFFDSKNENSEPQNVNQAFDLLVMPYWRQHNDPDFSKKFEIALLKILTQKNDINKSIYLAHDWIWYYLYCKNEGKLNPDGIYHGIFNLNLEKIAERLKYLMNERKYELIDDTRWGGANWNSENGMLSPLLRISRSIRDKLGGPDFTTD